MSCPRLPGPGKLAVLTFNGAIVNIMVQEIAVEHEPLALIGPDDLYPSVARSRPARITIRGFQAEPEPTPAERLRAAHAAALRRVFRD